MKGDFSEYLTISLYAVDVLIILILVNFAVYKWSLRKKSAGAVKMISLLWLIISGLDLFIFLSILAAHDWRLAVYKYIVFLLALGVFLCIYSFPLDKLKFLLFFIIGLGAQAFLGIYQFITGGSFASKFLGIASHNPYTPGHSVVETEAGRWLRAYGGFDHPNIMGGALAVGLVAAIYLYLEYRERDRRVSLAVAILFLVLIWALFLTFSRAAWIAAVFTILFIPFYYWTEGKAKKALLVSRLSLMAVLLASTLVFIHFDMVSARVALGSRLERVSYEERLSSLEEARSIYQDNFIMGVGMGNYIPALKEGNPGRPAWSYQPVHNTYILILSEIGVLGFTFFLVLLYFLIKVSFKAKNGFALSLLFSLAIMMMFDHWWWSLHFGIIYFWFSIGAVLVILELERLKNKASLND